MMAAFRAFAKSPWAAVLMGVLIISFGIWGVRDVFHTKISSDVITAGSRTVTAAQFKRMFDRQLRQAQQQSGQAITPDQAAQAGLDVRMLEQMSDLESVHELLRREGVQASDKLIVDQLRKTPDFFNKITGSFDRKTYEALLAQNDLSPPEYESSLRDDIGVSHFMTGMGVGLRAPRVYSALFAIIDQERRAADYFVLDQKSVVMPPIPTDADLTKFMKDNASALRRPELRQLSLVRFSAQAMAATLQADPAEVQKEFDFRKDKLSIPEKRSFVQLPAKDANMAATIAARLRAGDDPSAVGRANGVKPISYSDSAKTSVADPRVADVVFGLQPGQASGPINGEFGYSVVKLASVTPAKPAELKDVRAEIEQAVKDRVAQDKVYDLVQKYEDAHSGGSAMAQAAKTAGVQVYSIGPITADGKVYPTGQAQTGLNQKMLADAFSLTQGGETEVTDLGKGEYYAVRVEKVMPSALPTLDEIRPRLTQFFMAQELIKRIQAKASGLVDRLHKGEKLDAVAASAGAKAQHLDGVTRATAQQQQALGREFLGQLFEAKAGDIFVAPIPQAGVAVVRLDSIQPGAVADVARLTETQLPQLSQELGQNELSGMLRAAAHTLVKPKVDEALARRTIGVSEDLVASSSAKAPAPKS